MTHPRLPTLFKKGIDDGVMGLAIAYFPLALSLYHGRFERILKALSRIPDLLDVLPPLDDHANDEDIKIATLEYNQAHVLGCKVLPDGQEQYRKFPTRHGYYPHKVDWQIVEDNVSVYRSDMADSIVIELCAGDLTKVRHTLNHIEATHHPAHYILCDIISVRNLWKSANAELTQKAGYARNQIQVVSGDIHSNGFWQNLTNIVEALPDKGEKPLLFIMRGATFNNFTEEQQLVILAHIKNWNYKNGAKVTISIDNTLDVETLVNAYDRSWFKRWLFTAFCYGLYFGHVRDVDAINKIREIEVLIKAVDKNRTVITPSIVFKARQIIGRKWSERIDFEGITKLSPEYTRGLFIKAKIGLLPPLPFVPKHERYSRVNMSHWRAWVPPHHANN